MYKLPIVGKDHVCPICCTTKRGYSTLAKHMLDCHNYDDFKKVGIQPYILARSLKENNEKYKALWEPLETFVKGFSFDALPVEKISGRSAAVSAQVPA